MGIFFTAPAFLAEGQIEGLFERHRRAFRPFDIVGYVPHPGAQVGQCLLILRLDICIQRRSDHKAQRVRSREKLDRAGCLTLFGVPFAGVGVFMAVLMAMQLSDYAGMRAWEEVPCRITKTELLSDQAAKGPATYRVTAQ